MSIVQNVSTRSRFFLHSFLGDNNDKNNTTVPLVIDDRYYYRAVYRSTSERSLCACIHTLIEMEVQRLRVIVEYGRTNLLLFFLLLCQSRQHNIQ